MDVRDQKRSEMSQTQMEINLKSIIDIFEDYAIKIVPYNTLSKGEFRKLMKEQLPNFFQGSRASGDADGLFIELDENEDGQVSFKEFTTLVKKALMIFYNKLHQDD